MTTYARVYTSLDFAFPFRPDPLARPATYSLILSANTVFF